MRRWIITGACIIALLLAVFFVGYVTGRRATESKYKLELAELHRVYTQRIDESDRLLDELRLSVAESQRRVDSIGAGLEQAARIASESTDRNRRIAILLDGIEQAIRAIRSSPP